ncbi:MAG TPA: SDR family NAD(P)-dependent oxidoreductase, partial [Labilithrix sp.]
MDPLELVPHANATIGASEKNATCRAREEQKRIGASLPQASSRRDGRGRSGIEARMAKTIIVAGYGPGISAAVAERFGAEGFQVALVARNAERLAAGVKALEAKGVKAASFTAELGDPESVRAMVEKVRATLGSITVLEWTAYA